MKFLILLLIVYDINEFKTKNIFNEHRNISLDKSNSIILIWLMLLILF